MNRIRQIGNIYQVLITPGNGLSSDNALLMGNWEDSEFTGFDIIEFDDKQEAQCEAFKYPDINWNRLIINHGEIFLRLRKELTEITKNIGRNISIKSKIMTSSELKNNVFDRVLKNPRNFTFRDGLSDIISFTISALKTSDVHDIANMITNYRNHLHRDDLRIMEKKVHDNIVIYLYGTTEIGTIYQIRILPTLIRELFDNNPRDIKRKYIIYKNMQLKIDNE